MAKLNKEDIREEFGYFFSSEEHFRTEQNVRNIWQKWIKLTFYYKLQNINK
jgi:hypothetical protein